MFTRDVKLVQMAYVIKMRKSPRQMQIFRVTSNERNFFGKIGRGFFASSVLVRFDHLPWQRESYIYELEALSAHVLFFERHADSISFATTVHGRSDPEMRMDNW